MPNPQGIQSPLIELCVWRGLIWLFYGDLSVPGETPKGGGTDSALNLCFLTSLSSLNVTTSASFFFFCPHSEWKTADQPPSSLKMVIEFCPLSFPLCCLQPFISYWAAEVTCQHENSLPACVVPLPQLLLGGRWPLHDEYIKKKKENIPGLLSDLLLIRDIILVLVKCILVKCIILILVKCILNHMKELHVQKIIFFSSCQRQRLKKCKLPGKLISQLRERNIAQLCICRGVASSQSGRSPGWWRQGQKELHLRDLTLPLRQNRLGSGELLWGAGVHGKVTTS